MDIRRCDVHSCHYDQRNGCPFCPKTSDMAAAIERANVLHLLEMAAERWEDAGRRLHVGTNSAAAYGRARTLRELVDAIRQGKHHEIAVG
jgi:hypothetical protein